MKASKTPLQLSLSLPLPSASPGGTEGGWWHFQLAPLLMTEKGSPERCGSQGDGRQDGAGLEEPAAKAGPQHHPQLKRPEETGSAGTLARKERSDAGKAKVLIFVLPEDADPFAPIFRDDETGATWSLNDLWHQLQEATDPFEGVEKAQPPVFRTACFPYRGTVTRPGDLTPTRLPIFWAHISVDTFSSTRKLYQCKIGSKRSLARVRRRRHRQFDHRSDKDHGADQQWRPGAGWSTADGT